MEAGGITLMENFGDDFSSPVIPAHAGISCRRPGRPSPRPQGRHLHQGLPFALPPVQDGETAFALRSRWTIVGVT